MFLLCFSLLFCKRGFAVFILYKTWNWSISHKSFWHHNWIYVVKVLHNRNIYLSKIMIHLWNSYIMDLMLKLLPYAKKFSCNLMLPFVRSDIFLGYVHLQTNFRPYVEMLCKWCCRCAIKSMKTNIWLCMSFFNLHFINCELIIKKSSEIFVCLLNVCVMILG